MTPNQTALTAGLLLAASSVCAQQTLSRTLPAVTQGGTAQLGEQRAPAYGLRIGGDGNTDLDVIPFGDNPTSPPLRARRDLLRPDMDVYPVGDDPLPTPQTNPWLPAPSTNVKLPRTSKVADEEKSCTSLLEWAADPSGCEKRTLGKR